MTRKKIIIIASDRRGLFARQIKIAKTLIKGGFDITILAWDRTNLMPKVESIDQCKVVNYQFKPIGNGTKGLLLSYPFWWTFIFISLLNNDADIYHCENLYSLIPAIPAKILKRKKIVYDLVDFAATSFIWPKRIESSLALFENLCLRFADSVIVVNNKKQMISHVKKLVEIPNCPADFRAEIGFHQEQNVSKDNKFTIFYGGWISETRGLENLGKAVKDMSDVKVIIAGYGPDEDKLNKFFSLQNNIEFKGMLSNMESLFWTIKADALFAFYDPKIPINRLAVSAKIPEAMMCGRPIISNTESVLVSEIINKENCGLLAPYNDVNKIGLVIKKLKDNRNLTIELGQNGRKAFEREYNWPKMEQRLLELYSKI